MPEEARDTAGNRHGPEQSGAVMRFAAAGGLGSAEISRAADGAAAAAVHGQGSHGSSGRWDRPHWHHGQWDLGPWDDALRDPLLRGIVDATALLAGLLLAFCGVVLAARRIAGAMTTSPGAATILFACAAAIALLLIADRGSRRGTGRTAGGLARFGLLATVAAMALPLRAAAPATTIAAVTALALAGLIVCLGTTATAGRILAGGLGRRFAGLRPAAAAVPLAVEATDTSAATAIAAAWDAGMQQRFERCTLADGVECVRGRVRVTVPAGSRLGVAHVGFCPPLQTTPAVEATTDYDGVEAVVSAAEVLPWGVRVECRLDEPAEEVTDIPVDLVATARA
jgi:hypothetical protein